MPHIKCAEGVYVQVQEILSGSLCRNDNECLFGTGLAAFTVLLIVQKIAFAGFTVRSKPA